MEVAFQTENWKYSHKFPSGISERKCVYHLLIYQFHAGPAPVLIRKRRVKGKWYTPISNGISHSGILLTICTNHGPIGKKRTPQFSTELEILV